MSAVNSRGARIVAGVVGLVALVTGAVWAGQGLNLIPGSFMTGSKTWLFIGLVVGVVGLILVVVALRGSRPRGRR